ncbi:MAG: hypothetical protein KC613_09185, partial [Myxococcales bacterium]|nr:hypothetical protein [Myxococcales bacterium]
QVVIAADGSFTYNGPLGALGDDDFTYQVTDAGGAAVQATARLTLAHRVWVVQALADGDGRLASPLGTLEAALGQAEAGDVVFIRPGLSQLTAVQELRIPSGVQVVGEAAGLALGRNLAIPAGERPTVIGAPDLFLLESNVSVRGLRLGAERGLFHGAGMGDVALSDLVFAQSFGELLRIEDLRGPVSLTGCRTEEGARLGGGIALRGGEGPAALTMIDVDLAVIGNALFASNLARLDGHGVALNASGGAAMDLLEVQAMDLQCTVLESVGSFSAGLSLTGVTGTLTADEVRLNEAFEGGVVAQDGAPDLSIGQLTCNGGFNAVRFNAPDGQITVGEPGDEAALMATLIDESVLWARAGDITVHGLQANQVLGLGIQVPPGADLAQLTVAGARFDGLAGHALLVGENGEAFESTTVRRATLSDWVVTAPQAAPIHLNGVVNTALSVNGLEATDFAAGVDGVMGWGAGDITLDGLVLRGQQGAADGVRLIGDGALTVRITDSELTGAGGDNAVRLVGDGRPATADFAVVGARITGWQGDRISLDAGDGDTDAVLRADDNRIAPNAAPGFGAGIRLLLEADVAGATLSGTISAQNNVIDGPESHGIDVTLRDALVATASLLLLDNQVDNAGGDGLRIRALDGAQVQAAVRGNDGQGNGGAGLRVVSDTPDRVAIEGAGENATAALEGANGLAPVVAPAGMRVIPVGSVQP